MIREDVNIALHQAKLLFVRQTQVYILTAAALNIAIWLMIGWWWNIPEFVIAYCLLVIVLMTFLVLRVGARFSLIFGLIAFAFMLLIFPFSFVPLTALKQFQEDREYIDYKRRAALLPDLVQSSVRNLTLNGRFPLVAWSGAILGPFFIAAGYFYLANQVVVILGLFVFCIGLISFNRAIISIQGEKIIIQRSGLGGSLRRSNFSVIHLIEVVTIEQTPGKLRIRHVFVGTGVEREVLFAGSKKACKRIVDALTTHTEQNLYDLEGLSASINDPQLHPEMDFLSSQTLSQGPPQVSPIGVRTLISAIRSNQVGLVNQLLNVGVDVNAHDTTGVTPLQVAERNGNDQVVYLLKQAGATALG